jgi:pyruvate, water dikinase
VAAGVRYSLPLAELSRSDEPGFGGKSASLGELLAAGIPVPGGFALSTAAFRTFVRDAGLQSLIAGRLESLQPDDLESVRSICAELTDAIRSAPVPAAVQAEIARGYGELARQNSDPAPPVAVRSSAIGEDSETVTFAGQQQTLLWVAGEHHVVDAVRDCWASLYSPTAVTYRAQAAAGDRPHAPDAAGRAGAGGAPGAAGRAGAGGAPGGTGRAGAGGAPGRTGAAQETGSPAMGIAVQVMVDALISGVMFTCNPVSGDPSTIAVNASWGLGEAVVGGEVTPDEYRLSKVTGEVLRAQVGEKLVEYVAAPDGDGTMRRDVPPERQNRPCLSECDLRTLVDVARRVERHFGSHQDIEWAIARAGSSPANLFVLQSRPVTALPQREKKPPTTSAIALVMSTFGVDPARRDA